MQCWTLLDGTEQEINQKNILCMEVHGTPEEGWIKLSPRFNSKCRCGRVPHAFAGERYHEDVQ